MSSGAATAFAPNLASSFQEILTVAARLRSPKFVVGDSAMFRTQVRAALQQAESSAQALRYEPEDIRLASFAAVSLLDETILNSSNRAFRDWAQRPLMLDVHGTLHAGDLFFEYLGGILKRHETRPVIDLLEVYLICLLLGFRGRFSSSSGEQLLAWRDPIAAKIFRFRGGGDYILLSRSWVPQAGIERASAGNAMTRRALSCMIGVFAACVLALAVYGVLLNRGLSELSAFAPR